ncbi:MAG: hypothetical protein ABI251_05790 [Mycobacteriaceae bacterium]
MLSRFGGLAAVIIVAVVVVVLGVRTPVRSAGTAGESLGPRSGQQVEQYVADARVSMPDSGGPFWALVSLRHELTPAAAAVIPGSARVSRAVLRVPLDRVQTPQVTVDLADQGARVADLQGAMTVAADQLQRSPAADERDAAVAQVSVSRLRNNCSCVLALLVRGSAEELATVAAHPDVRAVEAAPLGTQLRALSLTPLLPAQVTVVDPGADDGAVPAA